MNDADKELFLKAVEHTFEIKLYTEYYFNSTSRHRFDFAIICCRLAIELQGGTWGRKKSGHTSGKGIAQDVVKNNLAVTQGWKVLYFTSDMIKDMSYLTIISQYFIMNPCSHKKFNATLKEIS